MSDTEQDLTKPILDKARSFPKVIEGTSCSQTSFKAGKKAFLYIGMQGGRYKAMFKLEHSIPEATQLAQDDAHCYEVGKMGWVTARFSDDKPMPDSLWGKWLDESYELATRTKSKKAKK